MERTDSFIKVWFWPSGTAPTDVRTGASSIDTDNWVKISYLILTTDLPNERAFLQGTPTAYFPNTSCDLETAFGPNNIIINLTFCEQS